MAIPLPRILRKNAAVNMLRQILLRLLHPFKVHLPRCRSCKWITRVWIFFPLILSIERGLSTPYMTAAIDCYSRMITGFSTFFLSKLESIYYGGFGANNYTKGLLRKYLWNATKLAHSRFSRSSFSRQWNGFPFPRTPRFLY